MAELQGEVALDSATLLCEQGMRAKKRTDSVATEKVLKDSVSGLQRASRVLSERTGGISDTASTPWPPAAAKSLIACWQCRMSRIRWRTRHPKPTRTNCVR